jgi:hypothetical protein
LIANTRPETSAAVQLSEPQHRRGDGRLHDHRFGIGQRVVLRVEDIGLEDPGRMPRRLVRDPRDDPFVQLRIGVVAAGEVGRVGGERPGVNDRHRDEQDERGGARKPVDDPRSRERERRQQQCHDDERDRSQVERTGCHDRRHRYPLWCQHPRRNRGQCALFWRPGPRQCVGAAALRVFDQHRIGAGGEADAAGHRREPVQAAILDHPRAVNRQRRPIVR